MRNIFTHSLIHKLQEASRDLLNQHCHSHLYRSNTLDLKRPLHILPTPHSIKSLYHRIRLARVHHYNQNLLGLKYRCCLFLSLKDRNYMPQHHQVTLQFILHRTCSLYKYCEWIAQTLSKSLHLSTNINNLVAESAYNWQEYQEVTYWMIAIIV